jgi:RimJ/RimL family protein N-acetyltransferase
VEAARKLGYVPSEQYLASQNAYPVQEEREIKLANGSEILIRPAHAADADALRALFHQLTPDDVYTRFFRRVRSLSYQDLQTLCNVNHETQVAFLAVTGPRENEVVVGSGCYFLNPTTNLAEVAYMVAPEWQGRGLGTALQTRLQEYATARGVRGFIAEILPSNARMISLAANAPGAQTTTQDDDAIQVTIVFGEPGPAEATNEAKPAKAEIKEPSEGKRTKTAAKKQRKK